MVLDTSAILALLFGEPEQEAFAAAIAEAGTRLVSAVSAFEAAILVSSRKGPAGARELDLLFHAGRLEVAPFTGEQLLLAREAYERYGKGRHAAGLDLGDCCSYALSRHSGEPLLYRGEAFARTDVVSALAG